MLYKVRIHLAAPDVRLGSPSQVQPDASPTIAAPAQPSPSAPPSQNVTNSSAAPAGPTTSVTSVADECGDYQPPKIDPNADPMEVLKSLKPVMTRSELTDRIEQCTELKGLSPAVSQVLRLTGADRCSIEQVANAIGQDHAIALKILKLANSAVYTRGEPVDSVQLAVSRIGLGQIRQTVLNLSVIDQFDAQATCAAINFGQFWEHAIAVGIIAAELAHALELDPDTAFTMGLLHDVGRMFFADQIGEVYGHVLDVARQLDLPAELVEARMLLYNHADVMDRVLHSWKFPKQLINPIVFHHLSASNIRGAAPRQIPEVAMLALANRLAHALMLGSSGNEVIYATCEICEMLKLNSDVIEAIHRKARAETDKVKFALLATSSTANWPQLRQVHRDEISGSFRPLFIGESSPLNAYRIFCEELACDDGEVKPNVGVIHIAKARERVPLTKAYQAAEASAGVGSLPLLILSPAGKLLPEPALMNGRRVQSIASPFTIPRFIQSLNQLTAQDVTAEAA